MSKLFTLPQEVVLTSSGDPIPGAKAYFYEAGTSTQLDVYTEYTLTTPHANPVIADAAGRFAAIYYDPNDDYKVKVTDASDVEIYTQDYASQSEAEVFARTSEEIAQGVTPTDYTAQPGYITRYGGGTDQAAATNNTALANALLVADIVTLPQDGDGSAYEVSQSFTVGRFGQQVIGSATGDSTAVDSADAGIRLVVKTGFPTAGGDAAQSVFQLTDRYQAIKNVVIDCSSIADHGIYGAGGEVTHGRIENVNIVEPADDGVYFGDSTWMYRFDMVRVTSPAGYGFGFYGSSGITTIVFSNCYVSGATSTGGFYLDAVTSFTMNSCAVDASPGFAIVMGEGSQGVCNGINCEGTAKLLDMDPTVSSGIKPRLFVNGGRFINYGNDTTPPATLIDNQGSLTFRGVHLSSALSYTAFLTTKANSKTYWEGNTVEVLDETNSLNANAYLEADSKVVLSQNSEEEKHFEAQGATPAFSLNETGGGANDKIVEIRRSAGVFQVRDLNDDYSANTTLIRVDRSGQDTALEVDGNYADDAAAATGGIPVGRWYIDSNGFIKQRLT